MSTRHVNAEDKLVMNKYTILGFHNVAVEKLSLLGCRMVWLDNFFLSFWRNILPLSSRLRVRELTGSWTMLLVANLFSYEESAPSCFITVSEDFINLSGASLAICTLWFNGNLLAQVCHWNFYMTCCIINIMYTIW